MNKILKLCLLVSYCGFTQIILEKAPKMKAFEVGLKYIHSKGTPNGGVINTTTPVAQFSLGWQLTGYQNKRKTFISVPMGVAYGQDVQLYHYGWKLTHDLTKNKKNMPYLGYNLLLNQLKIASQDNRRIGHETSSEFGYRFRDFSKNKVVIALNYGRSSFPNFNEDTDKLVAMSLKLGFTF